jgi:hypothetical protein
MGPNTLRPDRAHYGQGIADSANEQLLLNLVRLRYRDRPVFLELQSIVSQRALRGEVSAGATIGVDGGAGNEGVIGAAVGFEERPTVTYTPLQGEDFAHRILSPLTPETIILLSNSGWSIERLFLICVSRLNGVDNAPSASGPTPEEVPVYEEFHQLALVLRSMQKAGLLTLQVFRTRDEDLPRIDLIIKVPDAADAGSNDQLDRIRDWFNLADGENRMTLTSGLWPQLPNQLALNPRSLMGVFYFLSQGVEAPSEHEEQGLVTITRDPAGERFDWAKVTGSVFTVRAQREKPERAFVAVRHRGYWFHIDDTDLNSKTTFSLLHFLLALKSGSEPNQAPVLTISSH